MLDNDLKSAFGLAFVRAVAHADFAECVSGRAGISREATAATAASFLHGSRTP
jgi:hypothetical protein